MGNWDDLKASIALIIKENGNQEITGTLLQSVLLTMVNMLGGDRSFAGVATTSTTPGTPDGNVFYLASSKGVYANFDGLEVETAGIYAFTNTPTGWELLSISSFEGLIVANGFITSIMSLTKTEYDAIVEKDPTTLYLVTEAGPSELETLVINLASQLDGKADAATVATQFQDILTALSGKANSSDLQSVISTLGNKADLVDGKVPVDQLPEIAIPSANSNLNVYLSDIDSATPGYKKSSYLFDASEVSKSIPSVSANVNAWGEKYLYDSGVGAPALDSGMWETHLYGRVDSSQGVSKVLARFFKYSTEGVETELFIFESQEINNVANADISFNLLIPSTPINGTDRIGVQIGFVTSSVPVRTFTYLVGDGHAAHFNTTLTLRHSQLRGLNDDENVQHITSQERSNWNIAYNSLGDISELLDLLNGEVI